MLNKNNSLAEVPYFLCLPEKIWYVSDKTLYLYKIAFVFYTVLFVIASTVNSLVFYSLISLKLFKTPDEKIRIMLIFSDLISVFLVIPFQIAKYWLLIKGKMACFLAMILFIESISLNSV